MGLIITQQTQACTKLDPIDPYPRSARLDEREAHRYGVSGVPFFMLGGSYTIPGALSVESMKQVLQKLIEKEKSAPAQPEGMHCGPDGCAFAGDTGWSINSACVTASAMFLWVYRRIPFCCPATPRPLRWDGRDVTMLEGEPP